MTFSRPTGVIAAKRDLPALLASPADEWRWVLPRILGLYLVARLVAVVAAILGEIANNARPDWQLTLQTPILRSLASWDAVWYVTLASNGYSAGSVMHDRAFHNYVFFPAFPALMRALHAVTGLDYAVAGLLIANVCFILALIALYALGRRHIGRAGALIAVAFTALAPGAIGFSMAYGDSLFLLAVVLACLAAETRHDFLAAGCYAIASLTRLPGITLGLALLLLLVSADGWRPTRRWLILGAGPAALAAFYAYLWQLTGDPLANIHGQDTWSNSTLPPLAPAIVAGFVVLVLAMVAIYVASIGVTYRAWRHGIPIAYVAYAAVGLVVVVVSMRIALPRYVSVLFPLSWAFAIHPRWKPLLAVSAALYLVFAFAAFGPGLAP